jgi:phage internal scaffolding protein
MSSALRKSGIKDTDREKVSRFVEADFSNSPSLTSQSQADEVDINKIMSRVAKGQTILGSDGKPFYGDVSNLGGLQEAFIKIQEADELFMQYPAEMREKFQNDPSKFVDFVADPKNYDEALKIGLLKPRPVVPPPVPEPGVVSPAVKP